MCGGGGGGGTFTGDLLFPMMVAALCKMYNPSFSKNCVSTK